MIRSPGGEQKLIEAGAAWDFCRQQASHGKYQHENFLRSFLPHLQPIQHHVYINMFSPTSSTKPKPVRSLKQIIQQTVAVMSYRWRRLCQSTNCCNNLLQFVVFSVMGQLFPLTVMYRFYWIK